MSTLRVTTVTNPSGGQPTIDGLARAWVNFNGTGTVAIRASLNVSSITDNGTGDYTVNFTTALADANYSAVGNCGGNITGVVVNIPENGTTPTTSALSILVAQINGTQYDPTFVNVAVFR
jgi:lysozyme family protein